MWRGTSGGAGQWDNADEEQPAPIVDHDEQTVDHEWTKETEIGSVFPDAIPANQLATEHKLVPLNEERYPLLSSVYLCC